MADEVQSVLPKTYCPIEAPSPAKSDKAQPQAKSPAIDLEFVPQSSTAKPIVVAAPPKTTVDVSTWPVLERNSAALRARIAKDPSSVSAGERRLLEKIEVEISKRDASVPKLADPSKPAKVELCERRTEIPVVEYTTLKHHWIRTSHVEAGMGPAGGGVPGVQDGNNGSYLGKTTINDHKGQGDQIGSSCEEVPDVDEQCVEEHLQLGTPTGRWAPGVNDCHTAAAKILSDCKKPAAPTATSSDQDAAVP